jgi:hypothetical protein
MAAAGTKPPHNATSKSCCLTKQPLHPSVILALVVGIQRPGVRRVERLFQPKDLNWLDLCEEHRDDGVFR